MKNTKHKNPRLLILDKVGALGAFLAAAAAPCCFPLFAVVGSAIGLGALQPYRGYMAYALQLLVALALVGNVLAYRRHRKVTPLILGIASPALIFFAYDVSYSTTLIYSGLAGLLVTGVWNFVENRRCACCRNEQSPKTQLKSTLTCPHCGFQKEEIMPTDSCLFFYECPNCKVMLKPKQGDCCVFCSYGTVKCPPMQTGAIKNPAEPENTNRKEN